MITATQELTGAEVDLSGARQIEIALQVMVEQGGAATIDQIYEAVERNMPVGTQLSRQGRDSLRAYINREAVKKGYVKPYDAAYPGWHITPTGRDYLDAVRGSQGTEEEDPLPTEPADPVAAVTNGVITQPFDPATVRVDKRLMSIFQVMRKIADKEIKLDPDFQRNLVWNATRQSRLVESILLRIPLPAFYLDATNDDTWLVVDGLQRLTTLDRFCNRHDLALTNLEFLNELTGRHFPELPRNLQRLIEDTELSLYIIRPETQPQVKFTIFSRVNTGGLVLTPQEIRHALFQGRATRYLAELAALPEFLLATTNSISAQRMDDRECVLRFLAFYLNGYEQYGREQRDKNGRIIPPNLDGFLSETMVQLNAMTEDRLTALRSAFQETMMRAYSIFGQYAFRKLYSRDARRSPISKPLFEVWSVLLLRYERAALERSREAILDGFIALMDNIAFNKAISLGTGSVRNVQTRFRKIEELLERTVR